MISRSLNRHRLLIISVAAGCLIAPAQTPAPNPSNPSTLEGFKAGDMARERLQKATDLVAATGVSRGNWVADVGAGAGYYSMRLSEIVGDGGKVFAEDITDSAMRWLNARVRAFLLKSPTQTADPHPVFNRPDFSVTSCK